MKAGKRGNAEGMRARAMELVRSRELLWNLTRKEVKVRYKNSVLGFVWSMIYPLIMLAVYYVAFGVIFRMRSEGIEYFAFYLLAGILPWNFFSNSMALSVGSVVSNYLLVKKIYFPREVLPLSQVGAQAFHFLLQELVFVVFLVIFRVPLTPWILAFPLVMMMQILLIAGLSLFLSALNVYFRDVQYFTELLLLAWFWMNPIVYPITFILGRFPGWAQKIYLLNPMAHVTMLYQYVVYNSRVNAPSAVYISWKWILGVVVGSLVLIYLGYRYFTSQEHRFAEFI
ncbi:MAG: ABC transporter permease [Actinobacteria bacterium]|nr:ABC transporter permease [Actinomycetota bacterium]